MMKLCTMAEAVLNVYTSLCLRTEKNKRLYSVRVRVRVELNMREPYRKTDNSKCLALSYFGTFVILYECACTCC